MQKACKAFLAVMGRVLFIGFTVQIVLGICWMVGNFFNFQKFGDSILYEEISKTLICDEYRGILYPILIRLAKGMEELVLIPYHYILHLLQIGMAFFAAYKLLEGVGVRNRIMTIWGSLSMLTFPFALQCHLAVLPDSLVGSFVLLELAYTMKLLTGKQGLVAGGFVRVLVFWLLTALLYPEYFYLGAVPVMILFVWGLMRCRRTAEDKRLFRKQMVYRVILIGAFAGMIWSVNELTTEEGFYGKVSRSLNASLVSRCAWPNVSTDYAYWPEDMKEHITWEESRAIDYYADNMDLILGRTLESALGKQRAEEVMGEMAATAWQRRTKEIVRNIAWDVLGYSLSPIVLQGQLDGGYYDSYSGRNYDIMSMKMPLLTKYYCEYGCWWFAVALMIAAVMQLICWMKHKSNLWCANLFFVTSAVIVVCYAFRGAGMMDYKKAIAVNLLWILWMLVMCTHGMRETDLTKQTET